MIRFASGEAPNRQVPAKHPTIFREMEERAAAATIDRDAVFGTKDGRSLQASGGISMGWPRPSGGRRIGLPVAWPEHSASNDAGYLGAAALQSRHGSRELTHGWHGTTFLSKVRNVTIPANERVTAAQMRVAGTWFRQMGMVSGRGTQRVILCCVASLETGKHGAAHERSNEKAD